MRRLIVRIIITVAAVIAMLIAWDHAMARADVGGQQLSPGQCPYPAIGGFGLDGVAQHYVCDFPLEINNSRHHCVYGGAAGMVQANITLMIFSASMATPFGVLEGVCYWACPDLSVAPEPDPVQTWQGSATVTDPVAPRRRPCNALAPNPVPPEPSAPQGPFAPGQLPPFNPFAPPPAPIPGQQPVGAEPGQVL